MIGLIHLKKGATSLSLILQEKWQKQLASCDQSIYQNLYAQYLSNQLSRLETIHLKASIGKLVPLRQAKNHKNERLITCFFQNTIAQTIEPSFTATLQTNNRIIQKEIIIPRLSLAPNDVTLWTIIFDSSEETFFEGWLVDMSAD